MVSFLKLVCVIAVLALTGCSHIYGDNGIITNRETAYLQAKNIPAICIPPGLSSSTIEAHYPVSDTCYPIQAEKISLVPPNLAMPVVVPKPVPTVSRDLTCRPTTSAIRTASVPDYYFDSKTRSTHGKPAGTPIGTVFNSVSTWGKQHPRSVPTPTTTCTAANSKQPVATTATTSTTMATKANTNTKSNSSNPSSNSNANNPQLAQNNTNQKLPDYDPDAEKEAKEKALKQQFFDRYTHR